jgi:hypothetical protein
MVMRKSVLSSGTASNTHHTAESGKEARLLRSKLRLYARRMQSQTTLENLFPCLTPEEQEEARHALRRYLSFILRLHARITADPSERERFSALTAQYGTSSMDSGRTFTSQIPDTDV